MNSRQLDMLLGYLNEGTEIDETEFMMESLNEMVQNCIYESNMITSLLEEDNVEEKSEKKEIGLGTKIKEAIKKFINWVKSLITKLKIKIAQLNVKSLTKSLDKAITKQKEIAKNLDLNANVKLNPTESAIMFGFGQMLTLDVTKLSKEIADNNYTINNSIKRFYKAPAPIVYMTSKLTNYFIVKAYPENSLGDTVSLSEYLNILDELPPLAKNASKILDDNLKAYNDLLSIDKELYKEDPVEANKQIKIAIKVANIITLIATGSLKLLVAALKLAKKPLKNASTEE